MNFQVVLTNQAKADLIGIYRYIANDLQSPQTAEGQLSRLENAISSLDRMPERYRVYDHEKWKERNLRIMPVNNYLVFYIPSQEEKTVTVMRIMYGGRDVDRQLRFLQKNNIYKHI